MIGRSVFVSFSLSLPNISISLHKSWFMIHKREKWHGNSCKTTIYKWFEFCQNSETTNQNDSRDTKMARRFAILTNSKCSNFVKLSKRMHIRPHDKSSFEWILSNFIDGPVLFLLCFIQIMMSNSWCSGRFLWHSFEDLVFFIESFVVWCLCWRFLRFFHRILNMTIVFS